MCMVDMFGAHSGCAQAELIGVTCTSLRCRTIERRSDLLGNGLSNVAEGQAKLVMDAGLGAVLHGQPMHSMWVPTRCAYTEVYVVLAGRVTADDQCEADVPSCDGFASPVANYRGKSHVM